MRRFLKWIGYGLGGIIGLIIVAAFGMYFVGRSKLARTYTPGRHLSSVTRDTLAIARGGHVMRIHGCQSCHGNDLEGKVFLDIPPFLAVASNLTPGRGGVGGRFKVADWDRAIRHGLRSDGTALVAMPFQLFSHMSDEDVGPLIAFLQALPPMDNELPRSKVRPLGNIMIALMSEADIRGGGPAPPVTSPPLGTAEYGRYLASHTCVECHGRDLKGGKHPDPSGPLGPPLTPLAAWSLDMFATAVRTGVIPGRPPLRDYMPWKYFSGMTDDEVRSLHEYIKTIR
jgi:cytochrome c553